MRRTVCRKKVVACGLSITFWHQALFVSLIIPVRANAIGVTGNWLRFAETARSNMPAASLVDGPDREPSSQIGRVRKAPLQIVN